MCRFAFYLGSPISLASLVTEPRNSLIHQSYSSEEREEPLNGDGFGLAWYVPEMSPRPALFRSVRPAWNNDNLRNVARVTRSPCILAHVRAATAGMPVIQYNCHPFAWGPLACMHNGHVGGFRQLRRRILERLSDPAFEAIAGSTDSEHLFALIIDRYQTLEGTAPLERLVGALSAALVEVETMRREAGIAETSQLNVVLADGENAVVSRCTTEEDVERANSLYVHAGRSYVCADGHYRMIDPDRSREAVIVSSERLSGDPGWDRVPPNHLVVLPGDRAAAVEVRPFAP